jgi:hypothetical protein
MAVPGPAIELTLPLIPSESSLSALAQNFDSPNSLLETWRPVVVSGWTRSGWPVGHPIAITSEIP